MLPPCGVLNHCPSRSQSQAQARQAAFTKRSDLSGTDHLVALWFIQRKAGPRLLRDKMARFAEACTLVCPETGTFP